MNSEFRMIDNLRQAFATMSMEFGPKLLVAIVLLIAGRFVGKWISEIAGRSVRRFHLEPPVHQLFVRGVNITVFGLFAIMALQNLGVQLLPLIAGLGVAGAGVALAMQGVLSNLAAGFMIIFTKPFRVGDYISVAGEEGQVAAIDLSNTILSHRDLSRVVIPNRKIAGEILHNYGRIRQLDITLEVAPNTELDVALTTMSEVLRDNPRCLKEPAPPIAVTGFEKGVIALSAKPWVDLADYPAVAGEVRKAMVTALRARGIVAPAPIQAQIMEAKSPR